MSERSFIAKPYFIPIFSFTFDQIIFFFLKVFMTTLMLGLCLPLRFLLVLLLCCVSTSSIFMFHIPIDGLVACHPSHTEALAQFTNEFDSRSCNQTDYFNGIWCNNMTGLVTYLHVPSGCLSGTLKPNSSLFRLHHLRYLNLSYNDFTSSSLPTGFGNLKKLEVLSLSSNGFIGQVPSSFNNLNQLSLLDLSYNELTGSFPFLGNVTKLSGLDLSNNQFSTLEPNSSLFGLHRLRFLDLAHNNFFSSSVPFEFGKLNKLEVLTLSTNEFHGQVPSSFSNLSQLTALSLDHNELTSSFPLVQNLTKLSILNLASNHFFGTIPSSLFTLPFLSYLDLSENHLTGSIQISNSSSSRLQIMYLGKNKFEGKIINPISKLTNLKELELSSLKISYPIDLSLFSSLKQLLTLGLSGNSISGTSLSSDSGLPLSIEILSLVSCNIIEFPTILKTLKNLQRIDISNNKIKGKVPEWLWKIPHLLIAGLVNNSFTGFQGSSDVLLNSSLLSLDFAYNSMTGAFPIPPLNIINWSAWNNSFTGNIPLEICNRSSLVALDLSYNNFSGTIPPCLSNLKIVNLRRNNLEGSIPDEFFSSASTETLDVGYNRLTGKLPRSLLNCSFLRFLSVDNNRIQDTFPFWLKALPNLRIFTLRSNRFFGHLSTPDQGPLAFPELRILELSDNNFSGSLPPSYFLNWKASSLMINDDGRIYMGDYKNAYYSYEDTIDLEYKGLFMEQGKVLTSYSTIDFSANKLEGQIPESIGLLKGLIALNLSNNAFSGHIPLYLANLTELESLDLSRNQLSGTIPNGLKTLSFLAFMNVSHNQLKGEIPQGAQIIGQPKSSFEGNSGLCGLPLEERCFETITPPLPQSKQEYDEEEEQMLNWKAVVLAYGPGLLFGLAIAQVMASYKPEWLVKTIGPNNWRIC